MENNVLSANEHYWVFASALCGGAVLVSAREGVPRLLIDGIWRNWVMIQLLTKCVSCFCVFLLLHDDVCKSLMLSWASRPLMNHLSEIYFYNPTRSAFLHLHHLFIDLFHSHLLMFITLSKYISTFQEINSTITLLLSRKHAKNVKVFNDQQLDGFIMKLNQMMANFQPVLLDTVSRVSLGAGGGGGVGEGCPKR